LKPHPILADTPLLVKEKGTGITRTSLLVKEKGMKNGHSLSLLMRKQGETNTPLLDRSRGRG